MQDMAFTLTIIMSSLLGLLIVAGAALRGWDGWLALKSSSEPMIVVTTAMGSTRIEMADLKERIRKLEAIAAGVDP